MLNTLNARLLDPLNLTPHGFCLLWRPWLIWTDAISNVIIGVSYFSIPLALSVFARRRSDFLFLPAVWLFVAFIMLCGITHWLDVLTLWVPAYKVQAVFTAGTAAVSVVTAVASGMLLPKALGLPSHRQLHEAKVALIASARLAAFGQMAGGVAHEVNTPLAVIHGLASDLIDDCDATREEIVESAQRIVDYADRVTAIVRSLQNVARDGKKDPFYEAPVGEIVGQAMDVCKERFRQHAFDLDVSPYRPDTLVLCRGAQISQLLVNLLQNAFDAVQEQTGEKWVRVEVVVQDERVTVSVIDSGMGVPSELKEKIMEPFFTTKPVGKGTGLGLSLSRQIAEEHGGTLELVDWGGHTCFSLRLPISFRGTPGNK